LPQEGIELELKAFRLEGLHPQGTGDQSKRDGGSKGSKSLTRRTVLAQATRTDDGTVQGSAEEGA